MLSVGFLASCKDYDEDNYAQLNAAQNASLEDAYKALKDSCDALRQSIEDNKCMCSKDSTQKWIDDYFNSGDTGGFEDWLDDYLGDQGYATGADIDSIVKTVINNYVIGGNYDEAIAALNAAQAKADSIIAAQGNTINGMAVAITNLQSGLSQATALAERDSIRIDGLETRMGNVENEINVLIAQYKSDSIRISLLEANSATKQELADSIAALRSELTNLITEREKYLQDSIDVVANNVAALNDALNQLDQKFSADIKALQDDVKDLKDQVKELSDKVAELMGEINQLRNDLAQMVTGVTIQEVYNPAIGTFNTPLGVNTNILVGYYGTSSDAVVFPSKVPGVTGKTIAKSAGKTLVNDGQYADAGYVYMTVNPSSTDFTGLSVDLVNSLDQKSAIQLDTLTKADHLIKFGWTRADNYLYASKAKISKSDIEAGNGVLSVDNKKAVASALKSAIKNHNATSIKDFASELFTAAKSLQMDAQAVKVSSVNPDGSDRSVTSNYGVAACAVKPLDFNSLNALNDLDHIPGYSKAYTLLDKVNKKTHSLVNKVYTRFNGESTIKDIQALKINTIDFDDMNVSFVVEIDTTIYIDGLKYYLDMSQTVDVPVKFTQAVDVPIHIEDSIEVDLSQASITTPTVVITTNVTTGDGKAVLIVPVKDGDGKTIGNAEVPLDDLDVNADASLGDITIDGTVVAHINIDETQTVSITVDQTVQTTVNIQKWIYFGDIADEDGNLTRKAVRITLSKDFSEDIKKMLTDALGNVNDMLTQINKTVDDAKDLIDDINARHQQIDDMIDKYTDKVRDYLDKINDKALAAIHKISKLTTPVMLVNSSKGFGVLGLDAVESGNVTLVATTYSAGIVAPVLMKYVSINGTEVKPSDEFGTIDATSYLKEGKNDIWYSALDYAGNEEARHYVIYYTK